MMLANQFKKFIPRSVGGQITATLVAGVVCGVSLWAAEAMAAPVAKLTLTHATALQSADGADKTKRLIVGVGETMTVLAVINPNPDNLSLIGYGAGGVGTFDPVALLYVADTGPGVAVISAHAGIVQNLKDSITINVIAPASVGAVPGAAYDSSIPYGANAGARLRIPLRVLPNSVSFKNVVFEEGLSAAIDVKGYFKIPANNPPAHDAAHGALNPFSFLESNDGPVDTANSGIYNKNWANGSYHWNIEVTWKAGSAKGTTGFNKQSFTIDPKGKVTVTKFGATDTRDPGNVGTVTGN